MNLPTFAIETKTCMSVNNRGTDKEYNHLYLSCVYGPLFSQFKPVKKLLEIGIGGGCSAELWSKYLTPNLIIAIDTDKDFYEHLENRQLPNVKLMFGDAYSREIHRLLPTDLDIVIDDGPHAYWSLKAAARIFLSKLRPGGVIVIEDIPSIEKVKTKLLLSADLKLVCCFWLFDLRTEARLSDDSVALLIHKKGSACNFHFERGKKIYKPTLFKSLLIRQILFFERGLEFLIRKIYHGIKFRIAALSRLFSRMSKIQPN
jgi:SAM-dependent methyltransferase